MVDSEHVEIRYSLRPMTSLWRRHYDVTFVNVCKEGPPDRTQPIHSIIQLIIISYLTYVNKNITVLLMNW